MLQLVYVSSARGESGADPSTVARILQTSRINNSRDGVTGALYTDGKRFLQALEGPEEAVSSAYARIKTDPRHQAVVTLSSRKVAEREFGDWAMAQRLPGEDERHFMDRVSRLVKNCSPSVQATFESFAAIRR
jgi:hypothetical protein